MKETKQPETKKLLLVDDDPHLILLVQDYLEFRGYQVYTAGNGKAALKILEEESIDLIICDIMMPEMDGYALVEKIRQDVQQEWIPVIFLSAKGQTKDRIKGLNTGADVYMVKPFEPEELVAQVESILRQVEHLKTSPGRKIDDVVTLQVAKQVSLTPTEIKVVTLVAQGLSNREIAKQLKISQRTVESHVSNMLNKTGLHNRTELARWSIENELF